MSEVNNNINCMPAPSFLPATAVLEMTYRCNHHCLFCSCPWENENGPFDRREEMTTRDWKKLIDKLTDMGVCNLAFTGGEALMKEDIFEILEYATNSETEHIETINGQLQSQMAPPKVYLLSNGKLVNREVLQFCKDNDIQLSMSLPGLTTLQEHTIDGDVDHILDCFRQARELELPTVVNITVTKKNLHELYKNISAAFLAGANQLLLNRFLPGGRGLSYKDELLLSKEEITEMLEIAEEVLQDAGRQGNLGTELPRCVVDPDKYERLTISTGCSAAKEFFVVGPSGHIRVCNHSEVRLSHWTEIETLKSDPYWKSYVFKDYLPESCYDCHLIHQCDGGCREAAHIEGGSIDSPDPLLQDCAL